MSDPTDDDWPFESGSEIEGRYRIVRRLQAGSAGAVYEAEHKWTGHRVALKALHKRVRDHADRMRAEARALAEISHPNVVAITDGGVTTEPPVVGVVWFTMPLLHGCNLRQELNRRGALDPSRALRFGIQIADGSAAAHALGIVHRDLKPENVFVVEADDSLKVLDFGISKIRNKLRPAELRTTDRFRLLGTDAYMAPELMQIGEADARSDVYALGLILYEMLVGRHCWSDGPGPLDFPPRAELGARQIYAQPMPLRELVPHLPERVDRLVMRALEKNPESRQQSMGELSRELAEALESTSSAPSRAIVQRDTVRIESVPTLDSERPVPPVRASGPVAIRSADTRASLDAALVCGAARFVCEAEELTHVERGLRIVAGIEGHDPRFRGLLRALAQDMSTVRENVCARLRDVFERIGGQDGVAIDDLVDELRQEAVRRGWNPDEKLTAPIARLRLVRGAAALVHPKVRSDAAETALSRLEGLDDDTKDFAFSVLIAFARTPLELHDTPRGSFLALALGGAEDSELARNGLAEFVLSAANARDLGVETRVVDIREPPESRSLPDPADDRTMPTPASMATPPRPLPEGGKSPFNVFLAFAVAATLAVSIGILGVVLRKPANDAGPASASGAPAAPTLSTAPSNDAAPPVRASSESTMARAAQTASAARPAISAPPKRDNGLVRSATPSSATPKPASPASPLPGSGL